MPLYMFLHNLLNVLVQSANEKGLQIYIYIYKRLKWISDFKPLNVRALNLLLPSDGISESETNDLRNEFSLLSNLRCDLERMETWQWGPYSDMMYLLQRAPNCGDLSYKWRIGDMFLTQNKSNRSLADPSRTGRHNNTCLEIFQGSTGLGQSSVTSTTWPQGSEGCREPLMVRKPQFMSPFSKISSAWVGAGSHLFPYFIIFNYWNLSRASLIHSPFSSCIYNIILPSTTRSSKKVFSSGCTN
jgi:hypothetical protein